MCTPAPPTPVRSRAAISFARLQYLAVPGLDKVLALNSDSTVWGGLLGATAENINVSLATQDDSLLYNASQYPGFSVQPVFYCSNPHNLTPQSESFLFAATSAGLAAALLQVSVVNASSKPAAAAFAFTSFASVVVLEQVGGGATGA